MSRKLLEECGQVSVLSWKNTSATLKIIFIYLIACLVILKWPQFTIGRRKNNQRT